MTALPGRTKTALELLGPDRAETCHESVIPLLECLAKAARIEMRAMAMARAQTEAIHPSDAGRIALAIENLPVEP